MFRARVVDVAPESLTIEITGTEDKIDRLLEVLRPYGVMEMVRTGRVAMRAVRVLPSIVRIRGLASPNGMPTRPDVYEV